MSDSSDGPSSIHTPGRRKAKTRLRGFSGTHIAVGPTAFIEHRAPSACCSARAGSDPLRFHSTSSNVTDAGARHNKSDEQTLPLPTLQRSAPLRKKCRFDASLASGRGDAPHYLLQSHGTQDHVWDILHADDDHASALWSPHSAASLGCGAHPVHRAESHTNVPSPAGEPTSGTCAGSNIPSFFDEAAASDEDVDDVDDPDSPISPSTGQISPPPGSIPYPSARPYLRSRTELRPYMWCADGWPTPYRRCGEDIRDPRLYRPEQDGDLRNFLIRILGDKPQNPKYIGNRIRAVAPTDPRKRSGAQKVNKFVSISGGSVSGNVCDQLRAIHSSDVAQSAVGDMRPRGALTRMLVQPASGDGAYPQFRDTATQGSSQALSQPQRRFACASSSSLSSRGDPKIPWQVGLADKSFANNRVTSVRKTPPVKRLGIDSSCHVSPTSSDSNDCERRGTRQRTTSVRTAAQHEGFNHVLSSLGPSAGRGHPASSISTDELASNTLRHDQKVDAIGLRKAADDFHNARMKYHGTSQHRGSLLLGRNGPVPRRHSPASTVSAARNTARYDQDRAYHARTGAKRPHEYCCETDTSRSLDGSAAGERPVKQQRCVYLTGITRTSKC